MSKIIFFILYSFPLFVFAESPVVTSPTLILEKNGNILQIIASIISFGISIVGVVSVIGMTWAGIQMILASGEEEKIKKARYMIIYCFVGLVLAGLAYPVVNMITSWRI